MGCFQEEIVQGHTPPIEDLGTVANRIAMVCMHFEPSLCHAQENSIMRQTDPVLYSQRCLDQGAQGLYGVQNQKLQVRIGSLPVGTMITICLGKDSYS